MAAATPPGEAGAAPPPSRLPFEVIRDPRAMRARADDLRRDGLRLAVVPTMGFLHDGHLSLLRAARAQADVVILTIFVNPTQFGPGEDLDRYPRDEAGDLAKARACGVDLAFCPDAAAMYPPGAQTVIEVRELARPLCGAKRPGHFAGVATVVTKLFNLTQPHVAFFGQKDYQQLAIIRRLVRDLDQGVEIVGLPIVREPDGLAMSSRNAYLSADERRQARALSAGLEAAAVALAAGTRDAAALVARARAPIDAQPAARVDYVELRDAAELTPIERVDRPAVLAMAVFVGTTRLLDNRVLAP
ncbi:MAG: pantoate--beta-alanine ligase [Kofleriaceae bacterium]|nr:pantoate--beta-alanine ligase [Kofleriaceae bacterium]MCL4227534.1 pantoate--beta-alanine ligase [Myxococcales bacterium]